MTKKKKKNLGEWLGIIGNILMWLYLAVFTVIYPFYFKDGYTMIASEKYRFYMRASGICGSIIGIFILIYICIWGVTLKEIKEGKPIWLIDICVGLFGVLSAVSYAFSEFKAIGQPTDDTWFYEGALWGASGWFMGFMTYLILVFVYFILSRFFKYNSKVWWLSLGTAFVVFLWGILNRYNIFPIEMTFSQPAFISSMGNINWMCGYTSVFYPIGVGLFWATKNKTLKCILLPFTIVSFFIVLVNSSDSGVLSLAVMMIFLFALSFRKSELMGRFFELAMYLFLTCLVIRFIDILNPEARNSFGTLSEVLIGSPLSLIAFVLSVAGLVIIELANKKGKYPAFLEQKGGKVTAIVMGVLAALLVILITVNTLTNGGLPIIGKMSIFIFNDDWASIRGTTWKFGIRTFASMDWLHKLFGAGPDCMYFQAMTRSDISADLYTAFNNSRLTNAHNEFITLLVNIGVFGVASFIGIIVTSIKTFLKWGKKNPEINAFALAVVTYVANNLFSFEQITNIPFLFIILGIGAAAVMSESRKTVQK